MLNVAYYFTPLNEVHLDFRAIVLRQCGLRSIMVTDVNVYSVSTQELAELGIVSLPTTVARLDGKVILWLEGVLTEEEFSAILDSSLREAGADTYVRPLS